MEPEMIKGKPLCKEETKHLLNIIEKSPVVLNRNTNANSNKIKNEEWLTIAKRFNVAAITGPRTPQQLRLKWENLKKNARKRNKIIKLNLTKTDSAQDYIPPDEVLDKVINLLCRTSTSSITPLCEDIKIDISVESDIDKLSSSSSLSPPPSSSPLPPSATDPLIVYMPQPSGSGHASCTTIGSFVSMPEAMLPVEAIQNPIGTPKKLISNTPNIGKRKSKNPVDRGRTARNLALADYYSTKKRCLDERRQHMSLRDEKLKLENENLRLSNEKLRLENVKLKLQLEQLNSGYI